MLGDSLEDIAVKYVERIAPKNCREMLSELNKGRSAPRKRLVRDGSMASAAASRHIAYSEVDRHRDRRPTRDGFNFCCFLAASEQACEEVSPAAQQECNYWIIRCAAAKNRGA